jgi:DNA-binding transcriptional regulator YiaG
MTDFKFSSDNVKELRRQSGLTQQKAAESIQLKSSASWRDWESGRFKMSKGNVEYFCLKNNISFEYILTISGNPL